MLASPQVLTRHAAVRCQQRSVAQDLVALVLEHADFRNFVGDGVQLAMVTRKRLRATKNPELRAVKERVEGLTVLHNPADGVVVTVFWADGRLGRRYRRSR